MSLPVELWAMILARASDISSDVLDSALFQTCQLTREIYAATWESPAFAAQVIHRRCSIRSVCLKDAHPEALVWKFGIDGTASRLKALARMEPKLVSMAFIKNAITRNSVNLVDAILRWIRDENNPRTTANIMNQNIFFDAVENGCCELVETLFSGTASTCPPWLEPEVLLQISHEDRIYSVSEISMALAYFYTRVMDLVVCRDDPKIISHVLKFCQGSESIYQQVVLHAPKALLLCCETGRVDVAKIIFGICRTVKPDTLRKCVLSKETALVELMIEWHADHPDSTVVGVDTLDPDMPLEEDQGRFLCGVSREIWRRCVELSSRDGLIDILELLVPSTSLEMLIPATSLHLAVLNRHDRIVTFLLSRNVPVSRVAFATTISLDESGILELLLAVCSTPPPGAVSFCIDSRSYKCLKILLACASCPVTATDVLFAAKFSVNDDRRVFGLVGEDRLVSPVQVLDLILAACASEVASEALNMAVHEGDSAILNRLLNTGLVGATESTFTSAVFLNNRSALMALIHHQNSLERHQVMLDSSELDATSSGIPAPKTNKLFQVALTCAIDTENIPLLAVVLGSTSAIPTTSDLFIAARKARTTIARFLISENPGLAQAPLDLAVRQKNYTVLKTLIVCGAVPSLLTVTSAIEMGEKEVLEILLKGLQMTSRSPGESAASSSQSNNQAGERLDADQLSTVLGSAICSGNEEIIQVLILSGVFKPNHAHVYLAAKRGMIVSVKLMLGYQAILRRIASEKLEDGEVTTRVVPENTQSALDLAVREGSLLAVTVLITAGVEVGPYALASAIESGRVEILLALSAGAASATSGSENLLPGLYEETGSTVPAVVVALAIKQGSLLMLRTLLNGFNVRISPVLLLMGVRRGSLAVVQILLQHFHGPVSKDLLDAAFSVHFDIAELLIQYALDRNKD